MYKKLCVGYVHNGYLSFYLFVCRSLSLPNITTKI